MDRYAVFGHPIKHSKSPLIHACFAKQTGQKLSYEAILAPLDGFPEAIHRFRQEGGLGANVTLPFKQQAAKLCDTLSERARLAGAVNTLYWQGEKLCGDNTDGEGLVRDLRKHHIALNGRRVLLLGAGGAVRGVIPELMAAEVGELVIANRTAAKAKELASLFSHLGAIRGGGFDEIEGSFDLIINGTSASLSAALPPLLPEMLAAGGSCYDMAYGDKPTIFQQWASETGATINLAGLGMLVEQAAVSFEIWRGVSPATDEVYDLLMAQLGEAT
ncbi:shikimate dehydrogenase [Ferrimonas sediminicola]|uniref:Shikimate dehydrogenase (NADP(+)) n=1 Tax=Ferrimonas sediminicola TaxID=2569538 RepID=A0A4U1BA15_9GAMM|nr:shikimate dehydrogenase [Ferrimonas sediminicola]TKB46961.1 shikimate dehydrogenase [Ferrimonas sediminicola]